MWVQRSFHWMVEALDSARTTRARNFPFGGWMSHVVKSCAEVFPCRKTANKPC
ncbi:hypothetical protein NDU88_013308 [Pleurodeles waltl]|uniref:Uncharacterized protein n=1 Tax=Pleurodeles waltl TaxID=8319 RepID=A0AAV7R3E6_PLEWA|nr:hypothetical protein NDU88_013308 [Pleurodeles waltl]